VSPRPPAENPIPVALTIAGSDSGGGAGIQADLKTFEAHGVFGASVLTALTAQNTRAVEAVHPVPAAFVAAQLDAVATDLRVDVVKTGMLGGPDVVEAVCAGIERHGLGPLVVDPVMISKSGFPLLPPEAVEAVRRRLLPLADLATPNAHEAAALAGFDVRTLDDARRAAAAIRALGPRAVLVKGGHLDGEPDAVDVLLDADGEALFRAERIATPHTHGTGCTYASAIAANLARGLPLRVAVARAKVYLTEAIRHALPLGGGHGPTRHFWFLTGDEVVAVRP
jgi:hydroxymethylpyrimidine/phosphomethylpyrimidine kinase